MFASLLALMLAAAAPAAEFRFTPEFDLKTLGKQNTELSISGDVCRVAGRQAEAACVLRLPVKVAYRPDLALSFEYRVEPPTDCRIAALAVSAFTSASKRSAATLWFKPETKWTQAKYPFAKMKLEPGTEITAFTIYNRLANETPKGKTAFEVRNIKIEPDAAPAAPVAKAAFPGLPGFEKFAKPDPGTVCTVKDGVLIARSRKPCRRLSLTMTLPGGVDVKPGMRLDLDYRIVQPDNTTVCFSQVTCRYRASAQMSRIISVSPQWFGAPVGLEIAKPDKLEKIILVATIAGNDRAGIIGFDVRNVRLEPDPEYDPDAGIVEDACAFPVIGWKASRPDAEYTVTITDLHDPKNVQTVVTRHNYCIPEKPLAPGVYSWRITDGKETVSTGKKKILPGAHTWRLPKYDFAALAAKPHPRFLKYLHVRYPDAAALKEYTSTQIADRVPPPPEPYTEGKDPKIPSYIVWYQQIAGGVTGWTGTRLQRISACAAFFPQERVWRDKAKAMLLTLARDWPPEGGSHPKYADLQAANLLLGMVLAYDVCYNDMTPAERKTAADAIRHRGRLFRERVAVVGLRCGGNHYWDNLQCVAAVAAVLAEEPGMAEWFDFAALVYAYKILPSRGFDGETEEGLRYWSFGFGLGARYLDLAKHVAGLDLYQQPWVRATSRFPVYCAPPDGYMISFANTDQPNHSRKGPLDRAFAAKLAFETGDAQTLWYAGSVPAEGPEPRIPLDIPQSILFRHIGESVFNTYLPDGRENVQLGFRSGTYFGGHQHADQNGFVINAYSDKLAIDGGYYDWFASEHFLRYSIRSEAHNTILVDGAGQGVHRAYGIDGRTTAFLDTPEFGYVSGDGSKAFLYGGKLTKFVREIFFLKPETFVVHDRLAAPKPSTFSFLLHSHTDEPIAVEGNAFRFARPRAAMAGAMLLPENVKLSVGPAYTVIPDAGRSGKKAVRYQPEWTLTASNPEPVRELEFLAVMRVNKAGVTPPADPWKKTVTEAYTALENGEFAVIFNRTPGKPVVWRGRTVTGPAAAFRLKDGKIAAEAVVGETASRFDKVAGTPCTVRFDGRPVAARKYVKDLPDGSRIFAVTGIADIPEAGGVMVRRTAPGKAPVHCVIASDKLRMAPELPAESAACRAAVAAGKNLFSLVSTEDISVELASDRRPPEECVTEPKDFVPPPGAILREAEDLTDPYLTVPQELVRPGTSGGKMSGNWGDPGTTGEWEITVPKDGKYTLWIRAANVQPQLREFVLDGDPAAVRVLRWGATGGFGNDGKNWRWMRLAEPLSLTAGKHRFSLTQLEKLGSNLDVFAVAPVK